MPESPNMEREEWSHLPIINGKVGEGVKFERIRRITGYLVGTVERFNNAKRAEVRDRVKHMSITSVATPAEWKRPRRGSDGEAMKYGMQCIPIA